MSLQDGLIQLGVLVGVFGGIGYVILMKIRKNNPQAAGWLKKFSFGNIYDKTEAVPGTDKMEQTHQDERRTMM